MLRMFPPLRAAWALKGQQSEVLITGANAKRVLFGAINVRSARRTILVRKKAKAEDAQAFFKHLRYAYPRARFIWLLLDKASSHTAPASIEIMGRLNMRIVWLPKQRSELNGMDQLWKELKKEVAANRQAESIDVLAQQALEWVLALTPQQAREKASMSSRHFWLNSLSQHLWPPT